jgi:cyclopropane fatty-acyl-phospholipid synthase-like methyltransferase
LVFLLINVCQTDKKKSYNDYLYDFFYGENYFQIMGEARFQDKSLRSYEETLKQCVKEAKVHADSKWLGVTEKYIESQRLWHDRLKSNYYSLWKKCFDEATIKEVIPIYPDRCKIIVHYYCDPQKW